MNTNKTSITKHKPVEYTGQILPGGFIQVRRTDPTITVLDEEYYITTKENND